MSAAGLRAEILEVHHRLRSGEPFSMSDAALLLEMRGADIAALLARGEAAEADADRLAEACDGWGNPYHKVYADKVLRLHNEALALRDPS